MREADWDRLESQDTGKVPTFKDWFTVHKSAECKASMLLPMRRLVGLGDPSRQFTTNDVECENMNVKRAMDWRKTTWDEAANNLHSKVIAHYEELNRAMYKEGRYRLMPNYQHLAKEPYEWAAMTVEERRQQLQMARLKPLPEQTTLTIMAEECGIAGFSIGELRSVWAQAESILCNSDSIVKHPGNDNKAIVFEDDEVHTVIKEHGHVYICDIRCRKFRYFDGLFCQHTLTIAEHAGCLIDFLGFINSKISARSAAAVSALVNKACQGAGEKNIKRRKGQNNQLSRNIDEVAAHSSRQRMSAVPATAAVLPIGPGARYVSERFDLPPLTPLQTSMQEQQPFTVTFQHGLIRRCRGCNGEFSNRSKKTPNDIILKKLDFKEYPLPNGSGVWCRSNNLVNNYYHFNTDCIGRRFPKAEIQDILIYEDIKATLSPAHINVLHKVGLHTACDHE